MQQSEKISKGLRRYELIDINSRQKNRNLKMKWLVFDRDIFRTV